MSQEDKKVNINSNKSTAQKSASAQEYADKQMAGATARMQETVKEYEQKLANAQEIKKTKGYQEWKEKQTEDKAKSKQRL